MDGPRFVLLSVFIISLILALLVHGASVKIDKNNAAVRGPNNPVNLVNDTDEIQVEVHEQPSTGWFWQCSFDATIFEITSDEYTAHTSPFPIGGEWTRSMKMIGKKPTPASFPISCALGRHWQNDRPATDRFLFFVHVHTPHKPLAVNKAKPQEKEDEHPEPPHTTEMSGQSIYDPRNEPNFPPIRDQGQCGSCWAFGTVGQLEVMYVLKCGNPPPFDASEQFLVSCNNDGYSCKHGGFWSHQYHFDTLGQQQTAAGAVSERDFPYAAQDLPCPNGFAHDVTLDSSTTYFTGTNENIMANVLQYGAVGTYICVNNELAWWTPSAATPYFTGPDCRQVNHAVVIVGFDANQKYWIIRNSWGPNWGANGYLYIQWGLAIVGNGANYVQFSDCPLVTTPVPAPSNTCAGYPCSGDFLPTSDPAAIICVNACDDKQCCNAKATCGSLICPSNTPYSIGATVVCAGITCTVDECCKRKK